MRRLRRVKILATLGPASQDRAVVKRLLEVGRDAAWAEVDGGEPQTEDDWKRVEANLSKRLRASK